MRTRTSRIAAGAGALAALGAAATGWELTRRRDAASLAADPDRDVLDAPLPGRGRTVVAADGTRLAVWEAGPRAGPAVVLVHGWGMGTRFWLHQLRELSRDHRVIAYDQRGHAASGRPPSGDHSVEALGGDLETVLEACLPEGRRAVLVGHSMGAMTILAWAADHPRSVDRRAHAAVLADTGVDELVPTFFAELGVARVVADTVGVRAFRARLPGPRRTTPLSSRAVRRIATGPAAPPSAVALTEQLFLDCPADVRSAFGATLSSLDLAHGPARLTVPTTVVTGTHDRLTPPVHARRLAEALPDATLVEIPDAGHQAPLERPDHFTPVVRAHTAGGDARPGREATGSSASGRTA